VDDRPNPARYVLFPGRHHLLTRFQADYLTSLAGSTVPDTDAKPVRIASDVAVVWAVTSASHQNTRRNPLPFNRREAAIERLSASEGLRSIVVPVFDTASTERFADVTIKNVASSTEGRIDLTPDNTLVACSTPNVFELYQALGFRILPVEHGEPTTPLRPWDVLMKLVDGDDVWRELAHPATVDVYDRYGLADLIQRVHSDPVISDEGGLTETRQYRTYIEAFESAAQRKWDSVGPYVQAGRVLDIGCASGGMLEIASRDPRLWESDLIGVEVARHLYEECLHKKAQGAFGNPNVYFYQRNLLAGDVFPERSIDTTITVALTHEIYSYGERLPALRRFAETIFRQTVPGGIWINSDVLGPRHGDRRVMLELEGSSDGPQRHARELEGVTADEIESYLASLTTRGRLTQFAVDFARNARVPFDFTPIDDSRVEISLRDAMEFLETKDYTDNWLSECHELFCALSFDDWVALITDVGFEVDSGSRPWRNDWIVENRFAPFARIQGLEGQPIEWPDTHLFLACRRPINS
jgi:SAM-dependent methyltransferase